MIRGKDRDEVKNFVKLTSKKWLTETNKQRVIRKVFYTAAETLRLKIIMRTRGERTCLLNISWLNITAVV